MMKKKVIAVMIAMSLSPYAAANNAAIMASTNMLLLTTIAASSSAQASAVAQQEATLKAKQKAALEARVVDFSGDVKEITRKEYRCVSNDSMRFDCGFMERREPEYRCKAVDTDFKCYFE